MDYGGWEDRSGVLSLKNRTSCGKEPQDGKPRRKHLSFGFGPGKNRGRQAFVEKKIQNNGRNRSP